MKSESDSDVGDGNFLHFGDVSWSDSLMLASVVSSDTFKSSSNSTLGGIFTIALLAGLGQKYMVWGWCMFSAVYLEIKWRMSYGASSSCHGSHVSALWPRL